MVEHGTDSAAPWGLRVTHPPTVSVIIPTRDRPHLIESAIRSVLLQTHSVDEIVVVDDGSAIRLDGPALESLAPSIAVLRHDQPRGAAAARNSGIERVSGDVVIFLDDDDLIHPRMVEDALGVFAKRPDGDVVVFLYECFFMPESLDASYPVALLFDYRRLAAQPLRHAHQGGAIPREWIEVRPVSALMRYTIPIQSCVFRRRAIGTTRFPEHLRQGEDTYFFATVAAGGARFMLDDRVYAFVRRHAGNITRSTDRVRDVEECYRRMLDDGLLTTPDDVFLATLKIVALNVRRGGHLRMSDLRRVVGSPILLLNELRFRLANLRARRSLLKYYAA